MITCYDGSIYSSKFLGAKRVFHTQDKALLFLANTLLDSETLVWFEILTLTILFSDTYFSYFKSNEAAMGAPIQRIDLRGECSMVEHLNFWLNFWNNYNCRYMQVRIFVKIQEVKVYREVE